MSSAHTTGDPSKTFQNIAKHDINDINIIDDITDKVDKVENNGKMLQEVANKWKMLLFFLKRCKNMSKMCEQALFCKAEGDGGKQRAEGKIWGLSLPFDFNVQWNFICQYD